MLSPAAQRVKASFRQGSDAPELSVTQSRQAWEQEAARVVLLPGTEVTSLNMRGVAGERVAAPGSSSGRIIYHLHGGGYNSGSPLTHRDLAARLSAACHAEVVLPDYRLAPEHPFPAAIEDSVAGYRWLLEQVEPARVIVSGDSAGAGLALATLVQLRDVGVPLPAAGVFLSPWSDLALTGPTLTSRRAADPFCSREDLQKAADLYLSGVDAKHPLASPLYADLAALPPFLLQVGDDEVLLSDAERLAARAEAFGVEARLEVWSELWHVWHNSGEVPEAEQALREVAAFIEDVCGVLRT